MKSKAIIGGGIALIIIVAAIFFCIWAGAKINEKLSEINPDAPNTTAPNSAPNGQTPDSPQGNLPFGNPSSATANASNANNYLMESRFYTISYNRDKAISNWTAWRLTKGDLGEASRQNDFRPDERLPSDWAHVTPSDYTGSGFDRGHLCPSADRSNSADANSATFLMTNITPQTPELNQGPWEKLETYSRSMARREGNLFIIAGQYGNRREKVKNRITIPTNFWKIVVVIPPGADASSINANTRVIAVDMPNISGIKEKNWRDYKTTVRQIEQKTGDNFFSNLPQNIQDALETKSDNRQNFSQ
jgi:endonuclease G, mitochondrial